MHAAIVVPGNASTIPTHVFGCGLPDERYVLERFQAMSDRDIRRAPGDVTPANGHLSVSRPRTCRIAAASPKYSVLSRPSSHRRATLWTTGHTLKALGTRRGRLLPMASLGALRCRAGLQYLSCPHVAVWNRCSKDLQVLLRPEPVFQNAQKRLIATRPVFQRVPFRLCSSQRLQPISDRRREIRFAPREIGAQPAFISCVLCIASRVVAKPRFELASPVQEIPCHHVPKTGNLKDCKFTYVRCSFDSERNEHCLPHSADTRDFGISDQELIQKRGALTRFPSGLELAQLLVQVIVDAPIRRYCNIQVTPDIRRFRQSVPRDECVKFSL